MKKQSKRPKEPSNQVEAGWISAAEAGRRLGLARQAMAVWINRKDAPIRQGARATELQWPQFARWRERCQVEDAQREALPTDREAALARKANAEAGTAELDYAERLGQLVTIEDSAAALGRGLDLVTARLRGMPPLFAQFGPEVERAVEHEVEAVIAELHTMDVDVLDVDDEIGEAA